MRRLLLILLVPLLCGWPVVTTIGSRGGGVTAGGGGGTNTFTFVGSANGADDASDTTVGTTSGTISVQTGDLIIAAVQWEDNSTAEITTGSFDDNNNNNDLTKDSEIHNSGSEMNMHIWWGVANTTNATASFDLVVDTAVPYKKMVVVVYRPSGGTITKDISGTPAIANDTNASNSVVTGTFSTTGTDNVVCAFAGFYTSGTWSNQQINGGAADHTDSPNGISGWCVDASAALSSVTATATYSSIRYWVATAISFKL